MRIRRRLVAVTFDCIEVLAAIFVLCIAITFVTWTATAAQMNGFTKTRAGFDTTPDRAVSRRVP